MGDFVTQVPEQENTQEQDQVQELAQGDITSSSSLHFPPLTHSCSSPDISRCLTWPSSPSGKTQNLTVSQKISVEFNSKAYKFSLHNIKLSQICKEPDVR